MFALRPDGGSWGERDRTSAWASKVPRATNYTTPHGVCLRIGLASGARYPHHPMAAPFTVLIMAAGQGTRMRSDTPKVLHRIAGKPLVEWVVDAAREAGAA